MRTTPKPNIIFVTFDSGRADHMRFLGYRKNTTPFLDSLAKKGIYCTHAFATGPGSSVSFVGIFTSTYPLDYGGYAYIEKPRVLLSEVLRQGGYTTVGVHSSPYLSGYFGYDRGWDTFSYLTYFRSKSRGAAKNEMSPGLRKDTLKAKVLKKSASTSNWLRKYVPPLWVLFRVAERIFLFLRKILKDIVDFRPPFYTAEELNEEIKRIVPSRPEKPLFLWLHYLDTHAPHALFARKKGSLWQKIKYYVADAAAFLVGDVNFINRFFLPLHIDLYDISLSYVDAHIKKLLEYLHSIGIREDNSILIISADHGEAFLEHGSFGHPQMLFNVNIHVPLLFYGPRYLSSPRPIERPVSLIDLSPTILSFADLEPPESYEGKNIFDDVEHEVISQASESEGDLSGAANTGIAIIARGYKLIHWKEKRYLFSLRDEKEKRNLYHIGKEIVRDLESRIKKYAPKKL